MRVLNVLSVKVAMAHAWQSMELSGVAASVNLENLEVLKMLLITDVTRASLANFQLVEISIAPSVLLVILFPLQIVPCANPVMLVRGVMSMRRRTNRYANFVILADIAASKEVINKRTARNAKLEDINSS